MLVFSLDAVGKPAEYIRYGTVWDDVDANYQRARRFDHVEIRVNITTSVYNVYYLPKLVSYLTDCWPDLVTWAEAIGTTIDDTGKFSIRTIPVEHRLSLMQQLTDAITRLTDSKIDWDQKANAINAVSSMIADLNGGEFDEVNYQRLVQYVRQMDQVKKIQIQDRKSTRLNSSHIPLSRMPSSA